MKINFWYLVTHWVKILFLVTVYNNSHEVLQKLIDRNITFALLEENELQFRLYKEMEEAGLTVYDFYKNSYDVGYRLYGELKKLSTCTEQYILAHPEYFVKAYEKIRQVCS